MIRLIRDAVAGDALAFFALVLLSIMVLLCLAAPVLPFGRPDEIGYGPRLGGLTPVFPLGTDQLGRSVFARCIEGLQSTFLLAAASVVVSALAGSFVAMASAHAGRYTDELAMRLADILFSFPPVLLGLLVTAVLSPGAGSAMVVIAIVTFPTFVRIVRSATLQVMSRDFVTVATISGVPFRRRIIVHLLPNVADVIVVQLVYSVSAGMLIESAMSFLGIGVQAPRSSLGIMLRDGLAYIEFAPWLSFGPGAFLALAILSVNLLGDGLRAVVDPSSGRRP